MLLQAIFKLTGQGSSNRIPSMLRKQPKLFFRGFEQLRARAAKVHKEDPDLGMAAVADNAGAAVATTGGGGSGAAVATTGSGALSADKNDLVAKAASARTS